MRSNPHGRTYCVYKFANYIRTKIRFALLKSVLVSLRGVRGRQQKEDSMIATSAVAFGLVPEKVSYEAY